jgi:hypothetical protein
MTKALRNAENMLREMIVITTKTNLNKIQARAPQQRAARRVQQQSRGCCFALAACWPLF